MSIPQSRYIKIKDVLKTDTSVSRRNLSGLVLTTNALAPFGYVVEMAAENDVRQYFGADSEEYGFAKVYFASEGYGGKHPERISFTRYTRSSDSQIATTMMSQTCSIDLDDFRKPLGGDTTLVFNTTNDTWTLTLPATGQGGLSTCVCLSDVCSVFNAAVGSSTLPTWIKAGRFTFEQGRFFLRFASETDGELLPFGDTPLAEAIGFTEKDNVIISSGGGDANGRVGAISRVAREYDDFGSFCFLDPADDVVQWTGMGAERFWMRRAEEIRAVDAWLATENYRFMHVSGFSHLHSECLSGLGIGCSTHHVLFDVAGYGYEEAEAMGIFSTIDYGSQYEAEYSWMFRGNPRLTPLDIDSLTALRYSNAFMNYYGRTQEIGQERSFYQPGKNADGSDTSSVCAEIWLKDAIQTALINRFLGDEKVSRNTDGEELIGDDIAAVISEAVYNGTVTVPTSLTNEQRININKVFGFDESASTEVAKDGYCLSVSADDGSAKYVLMYHRNGNFRVIEGTHVI